MAATPTPMNSVVSFRFACSLVFAAALNALAQPAAPASTPAAAPAAEAPAQGGRGGRGGGGGGGGAASVVSPEVSADRKVTFRLYAPKATEVSVMGQWDDNKRHAMTKDERGVWSLTLGPLEPSYWFYNFTLDGIDIADPVNPHVKLRTRSPVSLVSVPGTEKPELWEARTEVPHGAVDTIWHNSKVAADTRHFIVYTPPDYDPNGTTRYPVLYLLHGASSFASDWTAAGRANFVADNLIAAKRMLPMIIVMPSGYAQPGSNMMPGGRGAGGGDNDAAFERYLLEEVIPMVEKKYHVLADRDHRALMGLSMGGGQALKTGLSHLELFSAVGGFSAASIGNFETRFAALVKDAEGTNAKLKMLFVGCGRQDGAFRTAQSLDASLTKANIRHTFFEMDGVHNYIVWRRCLEETATKLFR
jgi:enterochelin esterase-like enzyme